MTACLLLRSPYRFVMTLVALACMASVAVTGHVAQAVQPLSPAVPVTTQGCVRSEVTAGPDGVIRGFAQCGWALRYVVRSGSTWRTVKTLPYSGLLLTSTQDSTGSYLLFSNQGLKLAKVRRDGSVAYQLTVSSTHAGEEGALVAREGRWWAVWSSEVPDQRARALFEAGTMLGATASRRITFNTGRDLIPTLALRPGGGLLLAWPRVTYTNGNATSEIRLATNTGRGWASRALAVETSIPRVTVASAGAHTFISWQRDYRPIVASNESGVLRTRVLPGQPCATGTRLAVSAGRIFLAWNGCTAGRLDPEMGYTDPNAKHEVYLAERTGGVWSTATVFSGAQFNLGGLTAAGGKATVVVNRNGSDPSKFQVFSRSQS